MRDKFWSRLRLLRSSANISDKAEMDPQRKGLLYHFTKLKEAFTKNDYDRWFELWPQFDKECRNLLETHSLGNILEFDPFKGLEVDPNDADTEFDPYAKLDSVTPLPSNEPGSPPPSVTEPGSVPQLPPNEPGSPSPPADEISQKLFQADQHVDEASALITKLALDGSIKLSKESLKYLDYCQTHAYVAKGALQAVAVHLSLARLVDQGESLMELLREYQL